MARLFSRWLDTSNQECKSVRYLILAINRDEDTEEDSVLSIIDWTHLFTVFSLLCGSSGICWSRLALVSLGGSWHPIPWWQITSFSRGATGVRRPSMSTTTLQRRTPFARWMHSLSTRRKSTAAGIASYLSPFWPIHFTDSWLGGRLQASVVSSWSQNKSHES